jgi:hypothetical protein
MTKSHKHETKICARCNTEFECKSGSVLLCQCQTIVLSAEQLDYINNLHDDCLCIACLHELRTAFNVKQHDDKLRKYRR